MLGRGFTAFPDIEDNGYLLYISGVREVPIRSKGPLCPYLSSDCSVKTFIDDLRSDLSATYLLYIYLL